MIDHYDWAGGREAMLRFGPDTGPVVVAALPLFEEANRTRAFVVTILRLLAERGIAGALPDLPGQGESLVPTEATLLTLMRDAFESAADHAGKGRRPVYIAAIRSGALLDRLALAQGRWHFAPVTGPDALRELTRLRQAALGPGIHLDANWYFDAGAAPAPFEVAGNLVTGSLLSELSAATPSNAEPGFPVRTLRLESDPRPADAKLPGAPLWRRAEPDNDPALAALLADDIAAWVRACES